MRALLVLGECRPGCAPRRLPFPGNAGPGGGAGAAELVPPLGSAAGGGLRPAPGAAVCGRVRAEPPAVRAPPASRERWPRRARSGGCVGPHLFPLPPGAPPPRAPRCAREPPGPALPALPPGVRRLALPAPNRERRAGIHSGASAPDLRCAGGAGRAPSGAIRGGSRGALSGAGLPPAGSADTGEAARSSGWLFL